MPWVEENNARIFQKGIKFFPPQQRYRYRYGRLGEVFHDNGKLLSQFEISVSYFHPSHSDKITQIFGLDLLSYYGSYVEKSDIRIQGEKIEKVLIDLTTQTKNINENLKKIADISNSSGLQLSITSLRNIQNLLNGSPVEKIYPVEIEYYTLKEILGVNEELALNIHRYFLNGNQTKGLEQIEGINEEVIENIKKYFILEEEV